MMMSFLYSVAPLLPHFPSNPWLHLTRDHCNTPQPVSLRDSWSFDWLIHWLIIEKHIQEQIDYKLRVRSATRHVYPVFDDSNIYLTMRETILHLCSIDAHTVISAMWSLEEHDHIIVTFGERKKRTCWTSARRSNESSSWTPWSTYVWAIEHLWTIHSDSMAIVVMFRHKQVWHLFTNDEHALACITIVQYERVISWKSTVKP